MTTARFRSGALLSLKGKNYSLLRVIGENVWQLEEHSSRRIFEYSKNQLLEMFSRKELQFLQQADQNAFDN